MKDDLAPGEVGLPVWTGVGEPGAIMPIPADSVVAQAAREAMAERPTPETDAEWKSLQKDADGRYNASVTYEDLAHGMARHARRLERERDEAREQLAAWTDAAEAVHTDRPDEQHCVCATVYRKERDEARERLKAGGCTRGQHTTQFCAEAVDAIRQRDEANERAAIYAEIAARGDEQRDRARRNRDKLRAELADAREQVERFAGFVREHSDQMIESREECHEALKQLAAEREHADRLAAYVSDMRAGYGGQVAECGCEDCQELRKIDALLAAHRERRQTNNETDQ